MKPKTYKIFLASSSELLDDRREFSDLINYLNNENIRLNKGAQFQQIKWEWVDESVSDLRKQDDYNQLLASCDLFVMLYWTKVGKYSEEEFDLAYQRLKGTRKLFVYKKTSSPNNPPSDADTKSLLAFEQKLLTFPEHFVGEYATAEGLKHKVQTELTRLFDDGVLTYSEMDIAKCLSAGQPAVPTGFIGREDELRTIRRKMDEGGTLMLINSEGGMGKTSIAAKYWNEELYRYKFNAWLFCENGIVEELKKLAPQLNLDLAQIPESQHVDVLRNALQNLPKDCLLVLDNANDDKHIEAFQQFFAGLHWHVLITSRCQHVLPKGQEYTITHLPPPLAKDLFVSHYQENTPDFETLLERLLIAIGYNTLLVELFAKNMAELAAYGETLADFLKQLETEGLFLRERSFEVKTPYTQHVHKEENRTTDAILNALYDLGKLDDNERFWLVNMALLPAASHLLTFLLELFAPADKFTFGNQLKTLARKGWLSTDTKSYRLSPVVQKLVLERNQKTIKEDSKTLVERLNYLLETDGYFTKNFTLAQVQVFAEIGLVVANTLPAYINKLGLLYCNLSDYFRSVGNPSQAIKNAQQYSRVSEFCNDKEGLATSYERLGSNLIAQSKFDNALVYFTKMANIASELQDAVVPTLKSKDILAVAYSKLCEIYQAKGSFEHAIKNLRKAIKTAKKICHEYPDSERHKHLLSNFYGRFGEIYQSQGQFNKAYLFYKKSVKINQKLHQNNPKSESLKNLLSILYYKLGEIDKIHDKFDKALNYFKKDLQLTKELYEINPASQSHKNSLAICYFAIGTYYCEKEIIDSAIDYFQKGTDIVNELYKNNPDSIEIKKSMANSYIASAEIFKFQGKFEQALASFKSLSELYEEFFLINPHSIEIIYELSNSYYNIGDMYRYVENPINTSQDYYQKAFVMLEKLKSVSSTPLFQRLLEQVKNALEDSK